MLIEFSVSNFRSIREEQTLSLVAEAGNNIVKNTFTPQESSRLRLLKSAVIYGANASGKTNIIRAFYALHFFITHSVMFDEKEGIPCYEPFELDVSSAQSPSSFGIQFIGTDIIKYRYHILFNRQEVLSEKLELYKQSAGWFVLFNRNEDKITFGKYFEQQEDVPKHILGGQLYLSYVGKSPHKQIRPIYKYFEDNVEVWNFLDNIDQKVLAQRMAADISRGKENKKLKKKLERLIRIADTQINTFSVTEEEKSEVDRFFEKLQQETPYKFIGLNKYKIEVSHPKFDNARQIEAQHFDFKEESEGTRVLFALGGLILQRLDLGGVIFFDEFDNSLHPKLSKFLIKLFHLPQSNHTNAQLVLASHDTTLLDKTLFRKDQIWFTEKNKYGETELFCVTDFKDVPDNIPFDEWYLKGKFGGQPHIKEIEFLFENE